MSYPWFVHLQEVHRMAKEFERMHDMMTKMKGFGMTKNDEVQLGGHEGHAEKSVFAAAQYGLPTADYPVPSSSRWGTSGAWC